MEIVALAHLWVQRVLREGDLAVDATVGNGHDTVFLAEQVGANGKVLGFDVQEVALDVARDRLVEEKLGSRVELIHGSHADMAAVRSEEEERGETRRPRAILFNLGYLPGGDKTLTTQTEETMRALGAALEWVDDGGMLTLVLYPGHPEGDREARAVSEWAKQLRAPFEATLCRPWNRRETAPFLIVVEKRSANSLTRRI